MKNIGLLQCSIYCYEYSLTPSPGPLWEGSFMATASFVDFVPFRGYFSLLFNLNTEISGGHLNRIGKCTLPRPVFT